MCFHLFRRSSRVAIDGNPRFQRFRPGDGQGVDMAGIRLSPSFELLLVLFLLGGPFILRLLFALGEFLHNLIEGAIGFEGEALAVWTFAFLGWCFMNFLHRSSFDGPSWDFEHGHLNMGEGREEE